MQPPRKSLEHANRPRMLLVSGKNAATVSVAAAGAAVDADAAATVVDALDVDAVT